MKLLYQHSRVSEKDINTTAQSLIPYSEYLKQVVENGGYEHHESSINLPSDEALLDNVREMMEKKSVGKVKYFIVVGIGGPNLGTKAIYDALLGHFNILEPERFPKMIFFDTTHDLFAKHFTKFVNNQLNSKEDFFVSIVSKSGGTTETTANAEFVFNALQQKFSDATDRFVLITDENSKLWKLGEELGIDVLSIPEKVGGRFSVFSAMGLFPLTTCGIDIEKLWQGAINMRDKCIGREIPENPALISAILLFLNNKKGYTTNDNFIFEPELESVGKWYRQLIGESIGKEKDEGGNGVHAGITPTISIGSTDLHSVGQLYLGGPNDKFTTFMWARNTNDDDNSYTLNSETFTELVPGISGKTFTDIKNAILEGTKIAYQKQEIPFMEVILDDISEYSLGQFLQFKMIEMMYLGKLFNVNTFDQPHVELYKTETKRILNS
ncbi:hypothetical protein CL630_03910 [bacterium]|nr:hypothetical protein [bacterium]|tara:strand:+ start:63689 stop:65005 length:1317 start_codon:yes stop_codon:yes gene_type:complete